MGMVRRLVERGPKGPEVLDVFDKTRARRRTRAAISQMVSECADVWLEIGSGRKFGASGWVTMDIELECDLFWDLRDGIPFPDGTVSRIYSSHLFEHLTFREGQDLMIESLRVLKPGGEMSICVPNARLYLDAYASQQRLTDPFLGWKPAVQGDSFIDMVNYIAYMDGHHKCLFDEESLVKRMKAVGVADAALREFDPLIDSPSRDFESIYGIGHKPVANT